MEYDRWWARLSFLDKKCPIREIPTLSSDADNSTDSRKWVFGEGVQNSAFYHFLEKNGPPFWLKIASSQTSIRNAILNQRSPQPPEVGVWGGVAKPHVLLISGEKTDHPFFVWKLCHPRLILGRQSLTRGLHDLRKWVFLDGADKHTDGHCDSSLVSALEGVEVGQ